MTLSFQVYGTPQPQGSTRAFLSKGRPIITSDNKRLKPWRQDVAQMAVEAMGCIEPTDKAVAVDVSFYFARPKSLKKSITQKVTKPDADKLLRSIFDSLTGIVFRDDSQVTCCTVWKLFGVPERAEITIEVLE